MREIKFRAWDKGIKKLTKCFGYGKEYMIGGKGIDLNSLIKGEQNHHMVLMQYTGLKDKNGKEIYEGDIVKCGVEKQIAEVSFESGCFFYEDKKGNYGYGALHNVLTSNLQVIGNIYENPELL